MGSMVGTLAAIDGMAGIGALAGEGSRLAALAGRIEDETDRSADAILADLNDSVDLTLIESTLHMAGASLWRCIDRHF